MKLRIETTISLLKSQISLYKTNINSANLDAMISGNAAQSLAALSAAAVDFLHARPPVVIVVICDRFDLSSVRENDTGL